MLLRLRDVRVEQKASVQRGLTRLREGHLQGCKDRNSVGGDATDAVLLGLCAHSDIEALKETKLKENWCIN